MSYKPIYLFIIYLLRLQNMQCRSTLHVFKYTAISEHFIGHKNFTILLPNIPLFSLSSLLLLTYQKEYLWTIIFTAVKKLMMIAIKQHSH